MPVSESKESLTYAKMCVGDFCMSLDVLARLDIFKYVFLPFWVDRKLCFRNNPRIRIILTNNCCHVVPFHTALFYGIIFGTVGGVGAEVFLQGHF